MAIERAPKAGVPNMYRQGDVLIRQIKELPGKATKKDTKKEGRVVLEYGEVTGHAHAIKQGGADLYMDGAAKYLKASFGQEAKVVHDEHETIALPVPASKKDEATLFEVRPQFEFDYHSEMARQVRD
jgi:hypothetical protein